jgi:AraC-like DNA-binding protein
MVELTPAPQKKRTAPKTNGHAFSESRAWAGVGEGWQHLHGSFRELGYSIEWHDFEAPADLDWARSFHPGSVEICLNLAGNGRVSTKSHRLDFTPLTMGFYCQRGHDLTASRVGGEAHQFITVELSFEFLAQHLGAEKSGLHPQLAALVQGDSTAQVSKPIRLTSEHQQMIATLRRPPVYAAARRLWYHAKALEVAAALFYQPAADEDLFCQRQKRQNQERVQKVIGLLRENLAESLSLEEIGRRVGCSHFHLSRIFSQESGRSIFQQLRELRLERAAELLREGKLSVTQVALEVGYSSPSHFSTAFHEAFGCCPGLYPLATSTQQIKRAKGRG